MGLERKLQKSDPLIRQSRMVDKIDRILGPLAAACYFSGSDYLQTAGAIMNTVEIVGLKLPFIAQYLTSTRDYRSLLFWLPKEIISNSYPLGNIADIVPIYHNRTRHKLQK
ncbi:MAG: hypothetical protein ACLFTH_01975 [Candidatus Woesearchaeota archaeon]